MSDAGDALDGAINDADTFWSTVANAARVHNVDRQHLADTLAFVHRYDVATAGVIYGCARRLAHAGYVLPAPPAPATPDPETARAAWLAIAGKPIREGGRQGRPRRDTTTGRFAGRRRAA
jgi:hypothetical protein